MTPSLPTAEDPLHQILMALTESDDALMAINLDQVAELLEAGKIKVDNCKAVIDRLEMLASHFKSRKDEYAAAESTANKARNRLREHIAWTLRANGFEKFTGNEYVVRVQRSTPSVEVRGEPDVKAKVRWGDLVRVKYEWDLQAVRKALEAELVKIKELQDKAEEGVVIEPAPGSVATWAKIKQGYHPVFTLNKKGLLDGRSDSKKQRHQPAIGGEEGGPPTGS